MGIIVSAYVDKRTRFCPDTATLTISGKVTAPTCSTEVVNARCSSVAATLSTFQPCKHRRWPPMRGVTTQLAHGAADSTRQIVVNHYD
ncbi:DUF2574 family protein [Salmonella enterica subsp. enterica]|nr:DUF2574 family protein [Salmonella enterica subsp. enterica]